MEIFLPRCRYQTRGDALLHCITFPLSIDGLCFLRYHRFGFVFEITAFLRRRRLLVWLLHFDPSSPLVAALVSNLSSIFQIWRLYLCCWWRNSQIRYFRCFCSPSVYGGFAPVPVVSVMPRDSDCLARNGF
jgi:hypothetical protein